MMVESACRLLQAQCRCQSGTGSTSGSFHGPRPFARASQALEQALPLMWHSTGLHWHTSGSIRYALRELCQSIVDALQGEAVGDPVVTSFPSVFQA